MYFIYLLSSSCRASHCTRRGSLNTDFLSEQTQKHSRAPVSHHAAKKVFDSKICLLDVNIVANNKVKDLIQIVKREVLDKRWNDSKFSYILSRSPLTPLLNRPETRKPLHLILAMPQNRFCYKYGHFLRRAAKEGSFFKHII